MLFLYKPRNNLKLLEFKNKLFTLCRFSHIYSGIILTCTVFSFNFTVVSVYTQETQTSCVHCNSFKRDSPQPIKSFLQIDFKNMLNLKTTFSTLRVLPCGLWEKLHNVAV